GRRRRWAAEGRVGLRRPEEGIQLGVASAFPLPTPMDLRHQLGAVAAHLFRRPLRVQQFFKQLADARITVHRVPPAEDLWNDRGGGTDSTPGRSGLRRCPRRLSVAGAHPAVVELVTCGHFVSGSSLPVSLLAMGPPILSAALSVSDEQPRIPPN